MTKEARDIEQNATNFRRATTILPHATHHLSKVGAAAVTMEGFTSCLFRLLNEGNDCESGIYEERRQFHLLCC